MLTRDEKLVILIEECSEVIKAATKCLRFGWSGNHPEYGVNHEVLAEEVGQFLALVDVLNLDQKIIETQRKGKIRKAEHYKQKYGRPLGTE
jgi:hypothetical protein